MDCIMQVLIYWILKLSNVTQHQIKEYIGTTILNIKFGHCAKNNGSFQKFLRYGDYYANLKCNFFSWKHRLFEILDQQCLSNMYI